MGGVYDWLFSVEVPEGKVDELYPEERDDDPEAPERVHTEVHGFDDRFGEDAQTDRLGLPGDEDDDLARDCDDTLGQDREHDDVEEEDDGEGEQDQDDEDYDEWDE